MKKKSSEKSEPWSVFLRTCTPPPTGCGPNDLLTRLDHYGEMPIIVVVDCAQAEHGVILNISCLVVF